MAERLLRRGDRVPFVAYAPGKGVTEFRFCLRWEGRGLVEVLIHNLQHGERFKLEGAGQETFCANAWTHQGLDNAWIWRHFWCAEHDCPAFDLYVPRQAEWFEVDHAGDISFGRGR